MSICSWGEAVNFCCLSCLCRLLSRKDPQIPPPTDNFERITKKLCAASEYLKPTPRPQDDISDFLTFLPTGYIHSSSLCYTCRNIGTGFPAHLGPLWYSASFSKSLEQEKLWSSADLSHSDVFCSVCSW